MTIIITTANLDDLVSRYQAGESELKLAGEFQVSRSVIRRRLVKAGITPRNGSQANIASMSLMTFKQRQARTAASHIVSKVRFQPLAEREMRAKTRERKGLGISKIEIILTEMLRDKGIPNITLQKAVGKYNIDIAIEEPRIAVEVYGGGFHSATRHIRREGERVPYLLNGGWNMVIIWVEAKRHPLTIDTANYIVTFAQSLSGNESQRGEYRMIWGDGDTITTAHLEFYDFAGIKCPSHGNHA